MKYDTLTLDICILQASRVLEGIIKSDDLKDYKGCRAHLETLSRNIEAMLTEIDNEA